jgi:hypothetical protein
MAAGSTYVAIATTTLTSNQSDITFSSVSAIYTDLVLIVNGFLTVDDNVFLQFNGDTGSNYSMTSLRGDGTSATSATNSGVTSIYLGGILTTATGNTICSIQNYSNSTTYKTVLARTNGVTSGATQARAGLWRSTSAITSVKVGTLSGNFVSGAVFTIYGIAAA